MVWWALFCCPFNIFFEYTWNWSSVDIMMSCSFMHQDHLVCHLVCHVFSSLALTAKFISEFVRFSKFWYLFFKSFFSHWNLEQIYLRHLIFCTSILFSCRPSCSWKWPYLISFHNKYGSEIFLSRQTNWLILVFVGFLNWVGGFHLHEHRRYFHHRFLCCNCYLIIIIINIIFLLLSLTVLTS